MNYCYELVVAEYRESVNLMDHQEVIQQAAAEVLGDYLLASARVYKDCYELVFAKTPDNSLLRALGRKISYLSSELRALAREYPGTVQLFRRCKRKIVEVQTIYVGCDRATAARAGAADMFQVICLEDEYGQDFTHLIDQGFFYSSLDDVLIDAGFSLREYQAEEIIYC